ncbi:hypothetical protein SBA4_3140003 [Candidatus Sulfopaludibacter sp. SbA4]|nr:hypothetical protein SBA4_3140003 [Candidatus Sulfopaludibacter sp. SbA4]
MEATDLDMAFACPLKSIKREFTSSKSAGLDGGAGVGLRDGLGPGGGAAGPGEGSAGPGVTGLGLTGPGAGLGLTGPGATGLGVTGPGGGATGPGLGLTGIGEGGIDVGAGTGIGTGAGGRGMGPGGAGTLAYRIAPTFSWRLYRAKPTRWSTSSIA